jgi:putative inorganic carbon (HCO3(-)) transporter
MTSPDSLNSSTTHPLKLARRQKAASWVLAVTFLYTSALYLLLMVRDTLPPPALIVLLVLWVAFWILNRSLVQANPLNLPILLLLLLLPLSLVVSIDRSPSLTKVYGLALSASFFLLLVSALRSKRFLPLVLVGFVLLAGGICLLGLVGADWSLLSGTLFSPLTDRLPHLIESVPRSTFNGVNVNTIGGALTFFMPLFVLLLWDRAAILQAFHEGTPSIKLPKTLYTLLALGGFLLVSLTLLLTQSRGALLGSLVGILALAVWKDRRFLWVIPVVLLGIALVFLLTAHGNFTTFIRMLDTNEYNTLSGRLEAWRNAIYLIQDFPVTGAGIGTSSKLFGEVYTFVPFALQGFGSYHAHNLLLAVTIDLGIPGLILYAVLQVAALGMALKAAPQSAAFSRTLLMGLACGLLAHQVFGITDAFLLGTKLGLILWLFLGVIAALYTQSATPKPLRKRSIQAAAGLILWLLLSAAALSLAVTNIYISLAVALVFGICLGVLFVMQDSRVTMEQGHET